MARLICGEKGSVLFCDSGETIVNKSKEEKKQTNADRIRAMTDEELAEFLISAETHGYHDQSVSGTLEMFEWLQSEVEG